MPELPYTETEGPLHIDTATKMVLRYFTFAVKPESFLAPGQEFLYPSQITVTIDGVEVTDPSTLYMHILTGNGPVYTAAKSEELLRDEAWSWFIKNVLSVIANLILPGDSELDICLRSKSRGDMNTGCWTKLKALHVASLAP